MKIVSSRGAQESSDYDAAQINESLLYAVVCHRNGIDSQSAISAATSPPGTSLGWQFVERDGLPDTWWEGDGATEGRDTPYPQPCSHHPESHVHVVAAC